MLAPPAVRVLVDNLFHRKQAAVLLHVLGDGFAGLVGGQPRKFARIRSHPAMIVHRNHNRDMRIVFADLKILHAVAGRGMHTACAALQRHMIAHNDIGRAVDKRMLCHHIFELAALEGSQHFVVAFPARGQRLFKKALRHDIVFLAAADHMIGEIRAETNRHIAGQRPGRGGPDNKIGTGRVDPLRREQSLIVLYLKLDINRIAGILGIFDFRLRKRSAAFGAPVNRLEPLINIAFKGHFPKDLDLLGFKFRLQGQIRIIPFAEHAQTLELLTLVIDIGQRILAADFPQLQRGNRRRILHAGLCTGLQLNRQAMSIPTGHVRRIISRHIVIAHNKVLEDLIERCADMNIAIGIGRAVVQHIQRLSLILFHQAVVQPGALPLPEHLRLTLGQAGTHGEFRYRQVQRVVVILF